MGITVFFSFEFLGDFFDEVSLIPYHVIKIIQLYKNLNLKLSFYKTILLYGIKMKPHNWLARL